MRIRLRRTAAVLVSLCLAAGPCGLEALAAADGAAVSGTAADSAADGAELDGAADNEASAPAADGAEAGNGASGPAADGAAADNGASGHAAASAAAGRTADAVEISTVDDLLSFAEHCALDTWSRGQTFVLTADLDLAGRDFSPVPTFGGTFLGEGHTISGIYITDAGSDMGFFRFVQESAVIRGLHISGRVSPDGSAEAVGGVAGSNAGFIQNCSFSGTVKGKTAVGGIVGQNEENGEVAGSRADGTVSGENGTGGIAGRNMGMILKCENAAAVNTSSPDDDAAAAPENALEQVPSPGSGTGEETEAILDSHTDTGGIAGYSSGMVQNCTNTGAVGYHHVGYNVGGAVGRQSGYMANCSNSAPVYGRKDVGGIVGQAEPDILLNTDEDTLLQLREQLDSLNGMIGQALDHADAGQSDISRDLTAISGTVREAQDQTKVLLDQVEDFTDDNLASINSLSSAVTDAIGGLAPVMDSLSGASADLDDMGTALSRALDKLAASGRLADDVLEDAKNAIEDLEPANTALAEAVKKMREAAEALRQAVLVHNQEAVKEAVRRLAESIGGMGTAFQALRTAFEALENALSGAFPGNQELLFGALRDLGSAMGDIGTALGDIGAALGTISENTEIDWEDVQTALDLAGKGFDDLESAAGRLKDAMSRLKDELSDPSSLGDALGSSFSHFSDAADSGSWAAGELEDAFLLLRDVADRLAADGEVSFSPLGQETRDAGDGLFAALTDLADGFSRLRASVGGAGDALSADLEAISRQITDIFDLTLDVVDDVQSAGSVEDMVGDVSEEDLAGTRLGKVYGGANTGAVEGDRNVGGIAGAVAVDYSLDPEDDAARLSFGRTYELKAILQNCVNRGTVTGKRDCVGGVAGRMDLGTAIGCQSYGAVESGSGYAGGITGYADAAVRKSWAKCTISGTEYVGGIAGWASRMSGCRAIATILEGTEHIGSIAGAADLEDGGLEDNRFLDLGYAGIDGVSCAGIAEPVSFGKLRSEAAVPEEFLSFSLVLTADGEEVARIPFRYGERLSQLELPEVPDKEGFYGTWPEFDSSGTRSDLTVEAVYTPWVTLAASEETDGKLALALAEGRFTRDVRLSVRPGTAAPPKEAGKADVWEVSLDGSGLSENDTVPLRLLNRIGAHAVVRRLTDAGWEEIEAAENGSYLCFAMTGTSGVFCVGAGRGSYLAPVVIAAGAGILLLFLLYKAVKRARLRRRKRGAPG